MAKTGAQLVAILGTHLNDAANSWLSADDKLELINEAIRATWPTVRKVVLDESSLTLVAGTLKYSLPSAVGRILRLSKVETAGQETLILDFDDFINWPGDANGYIILHSDWGDGTARLLYETCLSTLATDDELEVEWYMPIIYKAISLAYDQLTDAARSKQYVHLAHLTARDLDDIVGLSRFYGRRFREELRQYRTRGRPAQRRKGKRSRVRQTILGPVV